MCRQTSEFLRLAALVTTVWLVDTCYTLSELLGLARRYSTCCIVEVSDPGFRVRHDDAFLDGIEHGFQETFLLRQAQKIILHVFRTDAAEALDEFFKKARFHKLTLR